MDTLQAKETMKNIRLLLVLLSTLIVVPALAHDHEHPELNQWYQGLNSGMGACCDGSEAVHLADVDWESKDGHYRVKLDGDWYDVPDKAVLPGPNLDGRTLVWPWTIWVGGKKMYGIRCFLPGTMS